jgi:TRAP-type C4-dicarboxylate transport system permease small subunit
VLNVIGIVASGFLMLVITADVVGRLLFSRPIPAIVSIAEYVLVIAVYCGVAYCGLVKGHVNIDLILPKLPERARVIINSVTSLASLAVLSVIVWRAALMVVDSRTSGEVSRDSLAMPVWPFRTVLVIGIAMFCLVLVIEIVHLVGKAVKK